MEPESNRIGKTFNQCENFAGSRTHRLSAERSKARPGMSPHRTRARARPHAPVWARPRVPMLSEDVAMTRDAERLRSARIAEINPRAVSYSAVSRMVNGTHETGSSHRAHGNRKE